MKIIPIFDKDNKLLSFIYEENDVCEFERLFDLWNDIEYLESFFHDNESYLRDSYWDGKSKDYLVRKTREIANDFEDKLIEYENVADDDQIRFLQELFEPLGQSDVTTEVLTKSKAKEFWLRIYALKVDRSTYIITGGAIKLTKRMEDHEATKLELRKLEKCRNWLFDQGITEIEQVEITIKSRK